MIFKNIVVFVVLASLFTFGILLVFGKTEVLDKFPIVQIQSTPSPTPFDPFPYQRPLISNKRSYLTVLVGDSNVEALGINANGLRETLITLYPDHEFVNYNYGFGSTNILSLPDRLNSQTIYQDTSFQPILSQGFDLIIIESFAYNPLSELSLEEGLGRQEEVLDESVKEIIKAKPGAVVALMTPLSPVRATFAKGTHDLTEEQRSEWVNERIAYINNVIEYAQEKNIPLINVYQESLTEDGDGNPEYINETDNIHPSGSGLDLINKTIAQFILENNIFPE